MFVSSRHGPLACLDPWARGGQMVRTREGTRVGAWRKPDTQGPLNTKETSIRNPTRRTRINETGDTGPGSQGSITRGVQNVQLLDTQITQPVPATVTSPLLLIVTRATRRRPRRPTTPHVLVAPTFFVPSLNVPSNFHHAAHFAPARHTSLNLTREYWLFFRKKVAKSVLTVLCWRGMLETMKLFSCR